MPAIALGAVHSPIFAGLGEEGAKDMGHHSRGANCTRALI